MQQYLARGDFRRVAIYDLKISQSSYFSRLKLGLKSHENLHFLRRMLLINSSPSEFFSKNRCEEDERTYIDCYRSNERCPLRCTFCCGEKMEQLWQSLRLGPSKSMYISCAWTHGCVPHPHRGEVDRGHEDAYSVSYSSRWAQVPPF